MLSAGTVFTAHEKLAQVIFDELTSLIGRAGCCHGEVRITLLAPQFDNCLLTAWLRETHRVLVLNDTVSAAQGKHYAKGIFVVQATSPEFPESSD